MANVPETAGRQTDRRKLVAVMHADVVGYSRLIGLDDTGTLERLRALRRNLIDLSIAEHSGRIVNTAGDALLIVFDSVDGAVRCAMKIQQQVPIHDGEQSPDRSIRFRIGINIGDVIVDGSDVHGDGVNVAARLQAECPSGAVCVSRAVREHVQGRLDLTFETRGPLNLKNIAQPVDVFVWRPDAATGDRSIERTLVHGTGEALPLPDKPSIAVLAFTNMSGDPEQEYFSDGIADDILTELSRSRSLFVIARNSSFTYKGHAVEIKQVARELGVRYVLEGSVRRSGARVRVAAQLIDAETANHIWADRYDRALEDVFAVQDEITTAIVTAILPAVADVELRRALRWPPDSLGAWEAYQRGLWHLGKASAADNERAKQLFERAMTVDQTFVPAYSAMAIACNQEGSVFGMSPVDQAVSLAKRWARRAVDMDENDAEARATLAWAILLEGISNEVWDNVSLALEINPNLAIAHFVMGSALVFSGQPSHGRASLLTALRLNPRDPVNSVVLNQIAWSYYFERDYIKSLEAAQRVVSRFPNRPSAYRCLAGSLGQLGRVDEAQDVLRKAVEISPRSFDWHVRGVPPWFRLADHEHMLDGLRKAGWQG
jgi:adenylate cyclase